MSLSTKVFAQDESVLHLTYISQAVFEGKEFSYFSRPQYERTTFTFTGTTDNAQVVVDFLVDNGENLHFSNLHLDRKTDKFIVLFGDTPGGGKVVLKIFLDEEVILVAMGDGLWRFANKSEDI